MYLSLILYAIGFPDAAQAVGHFSATSLSSRIVHRHRQRERGAPSFLVNGGTGAPDPSVCIALIYSSPVPSRNISLVCRFQLQRIATFLALLGQEVEEINPFLCSCT